MTAQSTVAEIEAAGGVALGIEVDVRDHEAVEADDGVGCPGMGPDGCPARQRRWRSWSARRHEGQYPRSGAHAACHRDEPLWDRLFLQLRRPDHEAAAVG